MEYVEEQLLAHNKKCVASTQNEDLIKYSFIVKEGTKIIGGIQAYAVLWGVLYIDTLWVSEE